MCANLLSRRQSRRTYLTRKLERGNGRLLSAATPPNMWVRSYVQTQGLEWSSSRPSVGSKGSTVTTSPESGGRSLSERVRERLSKPGGGSSPPSREGLSIRRLNGTRYSSDTATASCFDFFPQRLPDSQAL